jgi:hypothetical protein
MLRQIFFGFLLVLVLFMTFLMIGPRLPDDQQREHCVYNIHLPGSFGFSLNCDSLLFLDLAHNPSGLLQENNVRQDRPGFIIAASALALIPKSIFSLADEQTKKSVVYLGHILDRDIYMPLFFINYYLSYIALNILILSLSFYLFLKIACLQDRCGIMLFATGCLLIFNDVVKAFIWSPHTQMFNILLPLFCMWCFIEVIERRLFHRPLLFVLSALAGIGCTMYGSFFLYLPSVVCPALYIFFKQPLQLSTAGRFALRTGIISLQVILPAWLWSFYVETKIGSFYSNSTELYHHVVWMKDAWQEGSLILLYRLSDNFLALFLYAAEQGWIILILLSVLLLAGYSGRNKHWQPTMSPQLAGCLFTSGMFLFFFAMVGLIAARVAYTAIPPLIAYAAYTMQQLETRNVSKQHKRYISALLSLMIVFAYGCFELLKNGPYS